MRPVPVRVYLSEGEVAALVALAKARDEAKHGRVECQVSGRPAWLSNFIGVLGEYALGEKYLNVPIDRSISYAGDDGWDFEFCGKKIDTKTTLDPDGYLINWRGRQVEADILALCVKVEDRIVDLIGWLTRDEFLQRCRFLTKSPDGKRDLPKPNWGVLQDDLHAIPELLRFRRDPIDKVRQAV